MPNIDGYLLKDTVPNLATKGDIHSIPYIIGCTKDEMGMAQRSYFIAVLKPLPKIKIN